MGVGVGGTTGAGVTGCFAAIEDGRNLADARALPVDLLLLVVVVLVVALLPPSNEGAGAVTGWGGGSAQIRNQITKFNQWELS